MNIPSIAGAALDQAWIAAASVLKDVTVKQGPTPSYDPATDTTTTTWATTTTGKKGLPYQPIQKEVDAANMDAFLESRMRMLLLRSDDFPSRVAVDDVVTLETFDWQVKGVFVDPSEKLTILTLLR